MNLQQILDRIDALEEAQLLLSAIELDVFSHLGRKRLTAKQIAHKAGATPDGMAVLLNALAALKVLRRNADASYSNTPETYAHLCATGPKYKRGLLWLRLGKRGEWEQLLATVKKGRDLAQYRGGDDPKFRRMFTLAMHERSEDYAGSLAGKLAGKRVGRLLDFGGGPGSYSAAILRKNPKATAVIFDRPSAIAVARRLPHGANVRKRLSYLAGDLFETPVKTLFDSVLFSNILHIYDEQQNLRLLKKINQALKPGGRLFVLDYFLDATRCRPLTAAMFAVTMLLYTKQGKVYTFGEMSRLLKQAGFAESGKSSLPEDAWLIEAVKKS